MLVKMVGCRDEGGIASLIQFSIQKLQSVGAVAAGIVCLGLASIGIWPAYSEMRKYDRVTVEFARFESALLAVSKISAERGVANEAMGGGVTQENLQSLSRARGVTDDSLRDLKEQFSGEVYASAPLRAAFEDVVRRLSKARVAVDDAIRMANGGPVPTAVTKAVTSMFAAADDASRLRDQIGGRIVATTPEIGFEILMATQASVLREHADRLGSYVVLQLTGRPEEFAAYAGTMAAEAVRVEDIASMLRAYSTAYANNPTIDRAIADMDLVYLNGALVYAQDVARMPVASERPTVAVFTQRYIPAMKSVDMLRNEIISATFGSMTATRTEARHAVLISAGLGGLVILVLTGLALVLRFGLFSPFDAARQQINDIANGDFAEPRPVRHLGLELQDMFAKLSFLRSQQKAKHKLELERHDIVEQLKRLSETDPLTGLFNRRTLYGLVEPILQGLGSETPGVGIVLLDVDRFKLVNDRFGHAVGDRVLQKTATVLTSNLRERDIVSRYGGEEFLLVLRDVSAEQAFFIAEMLRKNLAETPIEEMGAERVTASFGVVWCGEGEAAANWDELVNLADRRLYQAKRMGRNRVWAGDVSDMSATG